MSQRDGHLLVVRSYTPLDGYFDYAALNTTLDLFALMWCEKQSGKPTAASAAVLLCGFPTASASQRDGPLLVVHSYDMNSDDAVGDLSGPNVRLDLVLGESWTPIHLYCLSCLA